MIAGFDSLWFDIVGMLFTGSGICCCRFDDVDGMLGCWDGFGQFWKLGLNCFYRFWLSIFLLVFFLLQFSLNYLDLDVFWVFQCWFDSLMSLQAL